MLELVVGTVKVLMPEALPVALRVPWELWIKELTIFSILVLIEISDFNGSGQNWNILVNILKDKRNTGAKPNQVWSCLGVASLVLRSLFAMPFAILSEILGPSVNAAIHIILERKYRTVQKIWELISTKLRPFCYCLANMSELFCQIEFSNEFSSRIVL